MAGGLARTQPTPAPPEVELTLIGAMAIDQLRAAWRKVLASDPPLAFSKDLLARASASHKQEKALGDLPPDTVRLLRSLVMPGVEPARQVKVGAVIVREHRGVMHGVLVVPGGFCWQGNTYTACRRSQRRSLESAGTGRASSVYARTAQPESRRDAFSSGR